MQLYINFLLGHWGILASTFSMTWPRQTPVSTQFVKELNTNRYQGDSHSISHIKTISKQEGESDISGDLHGVRSDANDQNPIPHFNSSK